MSALTLRGGRVLDPATGRDEQADVFVSDGRLQDSAQANATELDVSGCWVLPGLVDVHGRLAARDRSTSSHAAELRAASCNGVTTLCVPPDTDPVLDSVAELERLQRLAEAAGGCHVRPIGALTVGLKGEQLTELATLSQAGCIAFSEACTSARDLRILSRAASYASNFDLCITVQPNDPWLAAEGCVHDGPMAHRLGLPGVPVSAESVSISLWLELARESGTRLHFSKLSSARGIELVRLAKREGLRVTADTSLNHTFFDDSALAGFDNRFKLWPPLRSAEDREAIGAALLDGTLDAICSDHTPLGIDDTLAPFQSAEPGSSTFDAYLPAVLALGETLGANSIQAASWVTCGGANAMQLDSGTLAAGATADICIFDPTHSWTFDDSALRSGSGHSPWHGQTLQGRVRAVVQAGVYCDNETT